MKYLLDTNICIYLSKNKFPTLAEKIESVPLFQIGISSITLAELEYGAAKSNFPVKNRELIYEFIAPFEIVPFNEFDTESFGFLRAYLFKKGTPIGPYDMQIAAQCLSRNLFLITNNVKKFERVPGLKYENWTQSPDIL